MTVLLYGASGHQDPCVDLVAAALAYKDAEVWVVPTAEFPGELQISFRADGAPAGLLAGRALWILHCSVRPAARVVTVVFG